MIPPRLSGHYPEGLDRFSLLTHSNPVGSVLDERRVEFTLQGEVPGEGVWILEDQDARALRMADAGIVSGPGSGMSGSFEPDGGFCMVPRLEADMQHGTPRWSDYSILDHSTRPGDW